MSAITQQILSNQKASLDNFLAVQGALLNGFEKLVDLNLKVMKATFDEVSQKSKEAAQLQDVQEAVSFSSGLMQPNADKMMSYGKHVYDVLSGIQVDVTKLTETQFSQFQEQINEAIEQLAKNAPAGSEGAVTLLRSTLASANNAYETVAKSARQAAEAAESNIAAATDATLKAARSTGKTASKSSASK